MIRRIFKILFFSALIVLFLSFAPLIFAQENENEDTGTVGDYTFTPSDYTFLVEPAVCYITSMWFAYVYDPAVAAWSDQYYYGPFGGTGFVVNPETGHIITAGHVVDTSYDEIKWAILDEYIFNTYPDDYYELSDSDWNTIYDKFKVEGQNSVEPDREVWVQFNTTTANVPDNPDSTYTRAEVLKVSPWEQRDIAIIKITPQIGRALSSALIGDSSMVEIGDSVTIIGYPWTSDIGQDNPLNPTVTKGSISGRVMLEGTEVLQIQGDARPGNSGSPVLGEDGSVIGILTMGTDETNNYLRPANDIKLMLDVENKFGQVDKEWSTGLAMFRQNHFSEALKHFNAVLNLSAGHLLAQEYKAKAQANMGNDIPLVEETTAVETAEETIVPETVLETVSPETTAETAAPFALSLFGLNMTYTLLILGGALLLLVLIIVLLVVLLRRKRPKKTTPEIILTKGPVYIASPKPPTALSEGQREEDKTKMIDVTGKEIKKEELIEESTGEVEEGEGEEVKEGEKDKKAGKSKKKTGKKTDAESKIKPKFCPNCGTPVIEGHAFCANCGNKLT
jgi:V8-like Glu-specific endopeptidase